MLYWQWATDQFLMSYSVSYLGYTHEINFTQSRKEQGLDDFF